MSEHAARNLIERACEYGILAKMGNARRGVFYQAPELIDAIEEASGASAVMRVGAE